MVEKLKSHLCDKCGAIREVSVPHICHEEATGHSSSDLRIAENLKKELPKYRKGSYGHDALLYHIKELGG